MEEIPPYNEPRQFPRNKRKHFKTESLQLNV